MLNKILEMENEIASLKRNMKDKEKKQREEIQEMLKFSTDQKKKIGWMFNLLFRWSKCP